MFRAVRRIHETETVSELSDVADSVILKCGRYGKSSNHFPI